VRQKFTQKERDIETGLDYFGARYYGSTQGRFTSPDPLFIELGRLSDPQQLDLYQYTRNNPLKFRDPTGLDIAVDGCEQDQYQKRLQALVSFNIKLAFDKNKNLKVGIVDANGNTLDQKALKALGKTLKGGEKELFNAITDSKNHVTIDTGNGLANPRIFFGDGKSNSGGTNKLDFTDINQLDNPKNAGGFSSSQVIGHETLEAYAKSKGDSFDDAHNYANQYYGGLEQPSAGTPHFDAQNANLISVTADFPIHGGGGVNARITLQFVTPIPVQAIPTTKSGTQLANVVGVEKH